MSPRRSHAHTHGCGHCDGGGDGGRGTGFRQQREADGPHAEMQENQYELLLLLQLTNERHAKKLPCARQSGNRWRHAATHEPSPTLLAGTRSSPKYRARNDRPANGLPWRMWRQLVATASNVAATGSRRIPTRRRANSKQRNDTAERVNDDVGDGNDSRLNERSRDEAIS